MTNWIGYNNGSGLAEACQIGFAADHTNPVAMYLTFCEKNQHFPTVEDYSLGLDLRFHPGADDNCDDFKVEKEIMVQEGRSLEAINCVMCTTSSVGREIIRSQFAYWAPDKHWFDGLEHYNFEQACDLYVKKYRCPAESP